MSTLKIGLLLTAFAASFAFHHNANYTRPAFLNFWVKTKIEETSSPTNSKNTIQVALLLDTSNSMDGLIEQTKSQLWNILNKLALTKKDGEDPSLQIALYEYGNPNSVLDRNQIHKILNFTEDMDLVSEKLFSLSTNGGDEFCGSVITKSLKDLEWYSDKKDDLKLIYIAGNESFAQGPIDFKTACKLAIEKDVSVNTIFCGGHESGINALWSEGAKLGNGIYMSINQNNETVYIETPYDDEINQLNQQLNKTYIPIGREGVDKIANQKKQDQNASSYGKSNVASRAIFKSSKKYKSESWDLVDAYKKDKEIVNSKMALPDSISVLTPENLEARIVEISSERIKIQDQIQSLAKKRQAYIEKQKLEDESENSLDKSIIKSIEKQAKSKGYQIIKN